MIARPLTLQRALPAALLLGLAATSCGDADAHFTVNTAPDLQKMTVSVLGVFKEGRMSPESWDEIGPKISSVFGAQGVCPIAYNAKLLTDKPDLAEAVDDYSRANGVTDDLLDQLAPAANGDGVLVITVAGRPLKQSHDSSASQMPPPSTSPGMQNRGMGGAGMRGHGGAMPPPTSGRLPPPDTNAYEMSASLFSLRDHKSVALVTMGYGGQSTDEALAKFTEKLKESFTGYPCVGWHMDAKIDDKKIEAMKSE